MLSQNGCVDFANLESKVLWSYTVSKTKTIIKICITCHTVFSFLFFRNSPARLSHVRRVAVVGREEIPELPNLMSFVKGQFRVVLLRTQQKNSSLLLEPKQPKPRLEGFEMLV